MRIKILIILALAAAVLVSSTVGTLSSYTTVSSFGTSIVPDPACFSRQVKPPQKQKGPETDSAVQKNEDLQTDGEIN